MALFNPALTSKEKQDLKDCYKCYSSPTPQTCKGFKNLNYLIRRDLFQFFVFKDFSLTHEQQGKAANSVCKTLFWLSAE